MEALSFQYSRLLCGALEDKFLLHRVLVGRMGLECGFEIFAFVGVISCPCGLEIFGRSFLVVLTDDDITEPYRTIWLIIPTRIGNYSDS